MKFSTFPAKTSANHFEIVSTGVGHEIDRVVIAVLELHPVNVVASGTVDDPADFRPYRGHCAHPAWLKGRVESSAAQLHMPDGSTGGAERNHLSICGRIAKLLGLIALDRDDLVAEPNNWPIGDRKGSDPRAVATAIASRIQCSSCAPRFTTDSPLADVRVKRQRHRRVPTLMEKAYDCLIIGGGPAGLTAAIYCARFLLKTLVIDAGGGRARMIPRTHNHAGFPGGIGGRDLVERIAVQAIDNGARIKRGKVETLIRKDRLFEARSRTGMYCARTVIIATGITDRRPAMSSALHDAAVAASLLRYCPICDGFEMVDKTVAVIGTGTHGAREADFLRSYTRHVSLIAPEGRHNLTPDQHFALEAAGIAVRRTSVRLSDIG